MGDVVMLAFGGGSIKRSGLYDQVRGQLEAAGKTVVDFGGIMPNPTYAKAQEGAALAREHGVTDILAVSGGSVIDCCKVVVVQARGNLMWDSAMAENGILKLGRITDFRAHQIEHRLGAFTDCNHGQGLACKETACKATAITKASQFPSNRKTFRIQPGKRPVPLSAYVRFYRRNAARAWMHSAVMLIAISSGVSAPIARPMGMCTASMSACGMPAASICWRAAAILRREPIRPT